jgi:hypothetical protein
MRKEHSVIGQVLGHCRIVAKIGEGGMGAVYRAQDEVLHRDVAIKVVSKNTSLDTSDTCDGRLRVYRTRNAGASWEPLMRGLPQKRAYETILRDAMTADSLDPLGIFFGTRNGQIFGSRDEGKTWQKVLEGLPAVVCIRTAFVQDASGSSAITSSKTSSTSSRSRTASKASPAISSRAKSLKSKSRETNSRGTRR